MNPTADIKPPSGKESRWLSIRIAENQAAVWSVENITVFAQRVLGDWMLARDENPDLLIEREARQISWLPLHLDWKRWALEREASEIRFWPAFPDRPLVVKTRMPVIVPPHSSVDLYVNLPVWLEVSVAQNDSFYTLDTIAPAKLSNTWYGTHFEGQLCYAVKSRARRSLDDLPEEPLRAVCPLKIRNRSQDSLPVEKIRIHPDHLYLYQSRNRLWTNPVVATFEGKEKHIELNYHNEAPPFLKKARSIREAKQPQRRESIIDRLFFRTPEA